MNEKALAFYFSNPICLLDAFDALVVSGWSTKGFVDFVVPCVIMI